MADQDERLLMLIDDEPAQRRLVSALASRAGWRTIFAADAETALAMLGTQDGMLLDAVILDQWSPDYEPSGLIRDLRAERPALFCVRLAAAHLCRGQGWIWARMLPACSANRPSGSRSR